MDRITQIWSCSLCGMEIDIRAREGALGMFLVPEHHCPDGSAKETLFWFAWTWEAQGLIREWCSEEELKALRQAPERYIQTVLNPKLERQKAKWTIQTSVYEGRVLLKLR